MMSDWLPSWLPQPPSQTTATTTTTTDQQPQQPSQTTSTTITAVKHPQPPSHTTATTINTDGQPQPPSQTTATTSMTSIVHPQPPSQTTATTTTTVDQQPQPPSQTTDDQLKLAVAMALLRSKLINNNNNNNNNNNPSDHHSPSDALKWKQKAKERKLEIIRLKHDLISFEDGMQNEIMTGGASCKCYFFDNLGESRLNGDESGGRFSDVLRRRFLRQVRLKERRKRTSEGSMRRLYLSENNGEMAEQLGASVDFLVDLCDTISNPDNANFANWSHQAVDFILDSIKNIASHGKITESVEGVIGSLSLRLVRKMCTTLQGDGAGQVHIDTQFHVQHLLRKLGSEPCIGQRVILAVSQKISLLAENLLFLDPFESTFPEIHSSLYVLIQLIEFLVSDYLISWSKADEFTTELFEEWVTSILHARKGLQLLENRCGLYSIYMDRVIGLIAKLVGQSASLQKLNPNIVQNLFC